MSTCSYLNKKFKRLHEQRIVPLKENKGSGEHEQSIVPQLQLVTTAPVRPILACSLLSVPVLSMLLMSLAIDVLYLSGIAVLSWCTTPCYLLHVQNSSSPAPERQLSGLGAMHPSNIC